MIGYVIQLDLERDRLVCERVTDDDWTEIYEFPLELCLGWDEGMEAIQRCTLYAEIDAGQTLPWTYVPEGDVLLHTEDVAALIG